MQPRPATEVQHACAWSREDGAVEPTGLAGDDFAAAARAVVRLAQVFAQHPRAEDRLVPGDAAAGGERHGRRAVEQGVEVHRPSVSGGGERTLRRPESPPARGAAARGHGTVAAMTPPAFTRDIFAEPQLAVPHRPSDPRAGTRDLPRRVEPEAPRARARAIWRRRMGRLRGGPGDIARSRISRPLLATRGSIAAASALDRCYPSRGRVDV